MSKLERKSAAHRAWIWTLTLIWAILAVGVVCPRSMFAQDDKGGPAPADTKAPDAAAAPAAAAPATPVPQQTESVFGWFIRCNGWIGIVILGCSVYFIATVARLFMELRPIIAMPPEIIARCEALLEQRDFKSIFGVVKDDNSFFSTALSTGIAELPNGLAEAREAMEKVGESVITEMEKKISPMAVLGTLGPMIGLVGTLSGMIKSFAVIAMAGSGAGIDASKVASGISEALLLTFEGVFLSIPAIIFFAVFRNRVSTIGVTTMVRADQFLRHFAHAARGKGGPAPGAAAAAAGAAKVARP